MATVVEYVAYWSQRLTIDACSSGGVILLLALLWGFVTLGMSGKR